MSLAERSKLLRSKIFISRFLTRSGDQAWDFAVPIVLLSLFPGELKFTALYYLLIRLAVSLAIPHVASVIDRVNRREAARMGIVLQLVGVFIGVFAIWSSFGSGASDAGIPRTFATMNVILLAVGGILSGIGSSFMDIAIANDLVPATFDKGELAQVNASLRKIDLITEVSAPVVAGLLMAIKPNAFPSLGFYLIALWNFLSFFPEYGFLNSIFKERPDLEIKAIILPITAKASIFKRLASGWTSFFREPAAYAILAYAVLWLSALSPHGVLMTGFLKDEWMLPEWAIGIFRALGAVFGLAATLIYPHAVAALGLAKASRMFIRLQFAFVLMALGFFETADNYGRFGFLICVLFSRIALYGFSLGEMQIRQVMINPAKRGEVNGFASSITGIATLGLYGAGALLPHTSDFRYLIYGSTAAVLIACFVFSIWVRREGAKV